jgi:hypothetical protein
MNGFGSCTILIGDCNFTNVLPKIKGDKSALLDCCNAFCDNSVAKPAFVAVGVIVGDTLWKSEMNGRVSD